VLRMATWKTPLRSHQNQLICINVSTTSSRDVTVHDRS
jgi:hypothetical protein